MLNVYAPMMTSPSVETVAMNGTLLIRVVNRDDPEQKVELWISEIELLRNLALVHRLTHGPFQDPPTVYNLNDSK